MVSHLLRAAIPHRNDPHDWNSWDHYLNIHENRLNEHPFVISFQDSLVFSMSEDEGILHLRGFVRCDKNVLLEVEKRFDTRFSGNILRVRCFSYRYVALIPGQHLLLKYHNLHRDRDDYHHRIYDPTTGRELVHEVLRRDQFPLFTEVLDELQTLTAEL